MRTTGRAVVDPQNPTAHAICDRCGFRYNHSQLRWTMQWQGPKIQNTRFLVCETCWDVPQEQLRTIVLPADPIPIQNARPEAYVSDDNALSALGANASPVVGGSYSGSRIGNLTLAGGLNAAFDGSVRKQSRWSAVNAVSNSSYNNWVGINWAGDVSGITKPSSLMARVIKHTVVTFVAYAPQDRSFLQSGPTGYVVQGSPTGGNAWGAWTTIASGTTSGNAGETISGSATGGLYQFHRIAFQGDQSSPVSVAQVRFNVGETGQFS